MPITITEIRNQIRQVVDPLILKFRQELYGDGVTFGQYISDSKIPPNIPRTGSGGNAIVGSGTANRIAKFTDVQTIGDSLLLQNATGVILSSGILQASGIQLTGLATLASGTSIGIDGNNKLIKLTTAAGISSVPQRFGWYIDQDIDPGVNGPVYYFNTSFDLLEYNVHFKGVPATPFVFRVEMTDNYNPAFVGITPVWFNILAANGNSGAGDSTVAAGESTARFDLTPEITPLSRSSSSQVVGQGITPSGAYGIHVRLYIVSGALATGATISLLLRSNGSI